VNGGDDGGALGYGSEDNGFYGRRLLIVANKAWEADPLEAALGASPSAVPESYRPRPDSVNFVRARATRGLRGFVSSDDLRIDLWCLEELLPDAANTSSSAEKAAVLKPLLADPMIGLVIAFGTAASSPALPDSGPTQNGCVVIGRKVFVHDARTPNTTSPWTPPAADVVLDSALSATAFNSFVTGESYRTTVESRFLKPPVRPTDAPAVLADADYVALSDVNVTNPKDYAWADKVTFETYLASGAKDRAASLETTHGVIRCCTPDGVPFMFVSGIVNRAYHFADDVIQRPYAQNFAGAHNAGIAVAFVVPALTAYPW